MSIPMKSSAMAQMVEHETGYSFFAGLRLTSGGSTYLNKF